MRFYRTSYVYICAWTRRDTKLTSDLKCLRWLFFPFLQFGENEAPESSARGYLLRMRTLSGDDALLVHQHLPERADFLPNLLLRVPDHGHKDTVVSEGHAPVCQLQQDNSGDSHLLYNSGPYFFFLLKQMFSSSSHWFSVTGLQTRGTWSHLPFPNRHEEKVLTQFKMQTLLNWSWFDGLFSVWFAT